MEYLLSLDRLIMREEFKQSRAIIRSRESSVQPAQSHNNKVRSVAALIKACVKREKPRGVRTVPFKYGPRLPAEIIKNGCALIREKTQNVHGASPDLAANVRQREALLEPAV